MSGESYSRTSLPRATLVALSSSRDFRHRAWLCKSERARYFIVWCVVFNLCSAFYNPPSKGRRREFWWLASLQQHNQALIVAMAMIYRPDCVFQPGEATKCFSSRWLRLLIAVNLIRNGFAQVSHRLLGEGREWGFRWGWRSLVEAAWLAVTGARV